MLLNSFNFHLPDELIAVYPATERSHSRLMVVADPIHHLTFYEIENLIRPGDLLIFNNSKVIPARLKGRKKTGGKVEVLLERILDANSFTAQLRSSKTLKIGDTIYFADDYQLTVIDKNDRFFTLKIDGTKHHLFDCLERFGQIPLPPYIRREPEKNDVHRYQTVYAKEPGSVAAPTAGFHFDQILLDRLKAKQIDIAYLTLHIGAGTFAPVRDENIQNHTMHHEYFTVSQTLCENIRKTKANGGRVIAIGTTTLRALETIALGGELKPFNGETNIFIYPGFQFKCVDVLVTNFHLPCSTLLMLVCAFGGYDPLMLAYQQAIQARYRFYSYGDAMWIDRKQTE